MENKINIAKLLIDCPPGMELDCTIYDKCMLDSISEGELYPVKIQTPEGTMYVTKYGSLSCSKHAKCVIFPKGKTTWEGFVPPCKFKDGDIVASTIHHTGTWLGIFKQYYINNKFESYCFISANGVFNNIGLKNHVLVCTRLATEEEKAKLFQAIKDNGYHWNDETKTLEKLVEPRFKVGDKIKQKGSQRIYVISSIEYDRYRLNNNQFIRFVDEKIYELVPNKFDINTLKPFESKVLVRDNKLQMWSPAMWGYYDFDSQDYPYKIIGGIARYCIPYEDNEHLLGKTDDCDEYYKNW